MYKELLKRNLIEFKDLNVSPASIYFVKVAPRKFLEREISCRYNKNELISFIDLGFYNTLFITLLN